MKCYNPYPLGKLSKDKQRPEPDIIKEMGYKWDDPRDIITIFEEKVAGFAGSKYAVAVDCCSHGIFLALKLYKNYCGVRKRIITIPRRTYISIPMQIIYAGFAVMYESLKWYGIYQLKPFNIWDGAVRWTKGMHKKGQSDKIQIISFQIKKRIPIGKGGMILTNNYEFSKILKWMSYDGRDLTLPYDDPHHVKCMGYHYYMTPEDAARGIILMDKTPEVNEDSGGWQNYPDVEKMMENIK